MPTDRLIRAYLDTNDTVQRLAFLLEAKGILSTDEVAHLFRECEPQECGACQRQFSSAPALELPREPLPAPDHVSITVGITTTASVAQSCRDCGCRIVAAGDSMSSLGGLDER